MVYFQGSVLERKDTNNFNKYINNKNLILYLVTRFMSLMQFFKSMRILSKQFPDDEFILYFDDLDFEGLDTTVQNIYHELKKEYKNLYFTTFM